MIPPIIISPEFPVALIESPLGKIDSGMKGTDNYNISPINLVTQDEIKREPCEHIDKPECNPVRPTRKLFNHFHYKIEFRLLLYQIVKSSPPANPITAMS